jgi:malic enzyme
MASSGLSSRYYLTGTGCVTLAGIIAAAKATNCKITDMRFMCVGTFNVAYAWCYVNTCADKRDLLLYGRALG